MNRRTLCVISTALSLLPVSASAQDLDWSGHLSSSIGTRPLLCDADGCPLTNYNNRNVFGLQLDADISPDVVARAGVSLHNVNEAAIETTDDAAESQRVQPVSLRLEEAWIQGYEVLVPGLDVRVGNQRIRWGTGDGYSPTDRLNPVDLEDPSEFDRRLEIPAAKLDYHLGDFTFTGVWMPFFVPSLLARDVLDIVTDEDAQTDFEFDLDDSDPPDIRDIKTRVNLPAQSTSNMQYAARVAWAAPVADFAVGYYYGRDSLPQLSGEMFPASFSSANEIDITVTVRYPRLQMVAFETRAPLFAGLTGWLDAALIIPSRTRAYVAEDRLEDLARLNIIDEPDGDFEIITQTGKAYPNLLAGIDRNFGDFVYANIQYVYGFLFERDPDDLGHYLLGALRFPSYDNPIEFELRGGGEATNAFDAFGWTASARLSVRHADVLKFTLLGFGQTGQEGSTLRLFTRLSEVRLEVSAEF